MVDRMSNRELYRIYREPAAVNYHRGRVAPGLRIVDVLVFTRAFTIRNATLHGFITICLNNLTFYNRDF
jgi:hypothetical protein